MSKKVREISIFASSPSDTRAEREILIAVVDELNRSICPAFDVSLRVIRWEEDIPPSLGRPQSIINEGIGDYDVHVGFMWKRFGTPTGKAASGTEEELFISYTKWLLSSEPKVMFYFSEIPYVIKSTDEADQLKQALEFKAKVENLGLVKHYSSLDELARYLRHDLSVVIRETKAPDNSWRTTETELLVVQLSRGTAKSDKPSFLRQIVSLWADVTQNGAIADKVLTQLLLREELGSTAIGYGWAVPHIYHLPSPRNYVLLVCAEDGVDWDSPDRVPTKVFVFYLINRERSPIGIKLGAAYYRLSVEHKALDQILDGDYVSTLTERVSEAITKLGDDLLRLVEIKRVDHAR